MVISGYDAGLPGCDPPRRHLITAAEAGLPTMSHPASLMQLSLPNDAGAERAVLVVALSTPGMLGDAMSVAPPDTYYDRTRQHIARGVASILSSGQLPDVTSVTRWLASQNSNNLPHPSEVMELQALAEQPFVAKAEQHARVIREHWVRRQRILVDQWRIQQFREGKRLVEEIDAEANTRLDATVGVPLAHEAATTTVAEVISRIQSSGERIPLGFEPLDNLSKGGVFQDFRVFLGGAPGTGKTGLCSQLALGLATAGWCVRWIAVDEGPEEVFVRWLQQRGVDQGIAERLLSPEAIRVAEAVNGLDIRFSESPLIEVDLHWTDGNPRRVVFVDSLQQVTAAGAEGLEPRARVDAVLKAIKRVFSANRILTIATSELARGAYRNGNSQDATDPIAALKESGSLEYYASILAVMRSVKDEPDLIEVQVPKVRRGGHKGEFFLKANRARCLFEAVRTDSNASALAHDRALDELATRILEVLRRYPDGLNVTALRGSLRPGPGEKGARHDRVSAALARLKSAGAVKEAPGPGRSTVWRACSNPLAKGGRDGDDQL